MSSSYYVGSINVFIGIQGTYYMVDGIKYDAHFPVAWAINHFSHPNVPEDMSGPKECGNCRAYGSINDVFVGYCAMCSLRIYNFTRGGMVCDCSKIDETTLWQQFPYMQGVRLWQIGDRPLRFISVVSDDEEEEQEEEQEQQLQDLHQDLHDWNDIAYELYEMKLYQQLEIDLCL